MDKSHLLLLYIGILINFSHTIAQVAPEKTTTTERNVADQRNDNLPENPQAFAGKRLPRILNGIVSKDEDFGYHVTVMRIVKDQPYFLCGGAIISSRYVLTAAHCVVDYTSDRVVVRTGGPLGPVPSQPHREQRIFHRVLKIMVLKQYSKLPCRKHQHDIAVLKVQQAFELSSVQRYKKAILPGYDSDYEGVTATFTGYGADYGNDKVQQTPQINNYYLQYPKELRSMPLSVISNESCQDEMDVIITESSFCSRAADKNMQSCFEDDGGPLVYGGVIIGILNRVKCEDNATSLELFTKVSYYLHFINSILEHQSSADILIL